MPSRERRLNSLEFHRRSAHIGHHDKCETCLKLRKTLRRVYKQVDPYKDHRIGYAFAMDGITWSDQSRQGNKYTVVLRDIGNSGYLIGFHLAYKSDATDAIENTIIKYRNDPRFEDTQREQGHKLISEIHTDPAEEWRNDNAEFQAMCARIGVIIKYSSPDDKRSASHAENAVRLVERGTKSIMMETTCRTRDPQQRLRGISSEAGTKRLHLHGPRVTKATQSSEQTSTTRRHPATLYYARHQHTSCRTTACH
eukprot:SAG31_NODE_5542_length_2467_cov_14.178632_1_plen_253_part_00